jgi:hypothetical protein
MGFRLPSCSPRASDPVPLLIPPTDFSVAKVLSRTLSAPHYRFPAHGQSYIEIPREALHSQGECEWGPWVSGGPGRVVVLGNWAF